VKRAQRDGDVAIATVAQLVRDEDVRRPVRAPAACVELGVERAQLLGRGDLHARASPRR
jgi:hypothetical protein